MKFPFANTQDKFRIKNVGTILIVQRNIEKCLVTGEKSLLNTNFTNNPNYTKIKRIYYNYLFYNRL